MEKSYWMGNFVTQRTNVSFRGAPVRAAAKETSIQTSQNFQTFKSL